MVDQRFDQAADTLSVDGSLKLALLLLIIGLSMAPALGVAQDGGGEQNRYVFDEMQVFGEIDKPEAFYILRASSLDYENIVPVESFLDEMYRSAQEAPF